MLTNCTPDMTRVKWVRQKLRTVMVWVLPSIIIIAQSDTITIEYIIVWLKKISLEQLLFELGNIPKPLSFWRYFFPRLFWKELVCMFSKPLLPFFNFYELWRNLPRGRIPSQPLPPFRFCVCVKELSQKRIVEIVAASERYLITNRFKK